MKITQYELVKERLTLAEDMMFKLKNRALGDQGEQWFNQLLRQHLPEDWVLLEDLWLSVGGQSTQIDSLIITPREWWVINVKNHRQIYTYYDGTWLDGKGNQFLKMYNQIRRSEDVLHELSHQLRSLESSMSLRSSIVFVHPEGGCFIEDTASSPPEVPCYYWIEFLCDLYRLRSHHQTLLWRHRLDSRVEYERQNPRLVARELLGYCIECPDYAKLYPVSKEELLSRGRVGILCPKCRRYYQEVLHKNLICVCGHTETKGHAIKRTIDEFMQITDIQAVTSGEINRFIGDKVGKSAVTRTLRKNFKLCGYGRGTYYVPK